MGPGRIPGEIVGETEGRLGIAEQWLRRDDSLQFLPGFQRAARFEEQAGQPVSKIVKVGPEANRSLVLGNGLVGVTDFRVGIAKAGMKVREAGRHRPRIAPRTDVPERSCPLERRIRLRRPAQLRQRHPAVDQRIDVPRVDLEALIKGLYRLFRLAQQ